MESHQPPLLVVAHSVQLVMEVLKKLEGAYALLIVSTHYPGEMVACKRGSPLILGVKVSTGWQVLVGGLVIEAGRKRGAVVHWYALRICP